MIRWTSREWEAIAKNLVARRVDPKKHGWRSDMIEAMQNELPKDRWRDPGSLNNTKEILAPIMAQLQAAPACFTPVPEAKKVEVRPHQELTTEFLLVELAKRLAAWLEPVVARSEPVDRGFYSPPEVALVPKVDMKPRLLIVGPKNGQQTELCAAHPGLDLRFVASDEGPSRIDSIGGYCDEIILWTNYLNHQHQVHAKATKQPTYYVSGGLSSIHERLSQWETR